MTRTILINEDDAGLRDLEILVLSSAGYQVMLAPHGQAALDQLDRQLPDLVLLDMKLPVMNGWEFARVFRARYGDRIPIVVVTAAEDAAQRATEVSAQAYVSKPFDIDHLVTAVNRQLDLAC